MNFMYSLLDHAHSGLRWIALLLLIAAVFKAINGWLGKKKYLPGDRKLASFTVISIHLQLVIGLVLYFVSPTIAEALNDFGTAMKNPTLRFYGLEHSIGMLVAIIFITIASASSKRAQDDTTKHKRIAIWFGLGLILILTMIPWPFRAAGIARGWF
jgi:hypothetical protein